MYEKFYSLAEDKQQRIINAGLEVFGQYDYNTPVADLMAPNGILCYFIISKTKKIFIYSYITT